MHMSSDLNSASPRRAKTGSAISCRSYFALVAAAALAIGSVGCSPAEFRIEVRVRFPGDAPLAGLTISALPFDRGAIRDSLARAARIPRPRFPDLEAALASYSRPDITALAESLLPWQALHDSVQLLADSLHAAVSDSAPQYVGAYARLRELYQRLAQSSADRDAAIREQIGDDRQLALRAAAAADSLRAWDAYAFAQFPELADSTLARAGRGIHVATTDNEGIAEFALAPGPWWIVATWVDPNNPFREYHWNVGAVVRRFGARLIPLHARNGVAQWRY